MEFIEPNLAKYIEQHTDVEPELLYKLNRETQLKILRPRMISGHFQGRVLSMLMKMIRPTTILEIGTYTGYSALCMAEGLTEKGSLTTIDKNVELENIVTKYFSLSEYSSKLNYIIGDALKIIPTLTETYDVVFIDADKENYGTYFDLVFDKLNIGGYIIADNVLWSGKVIDDTIKIDKDTQALLDFNDKVQADERVENVLFPIRDGLLIVRKIKN
jgi:predicted O-methyltransferase YrrM